MKPVPTIAKSSPLKIEEIQEEYKESLTEKRGKIVFWVGIMFFVIVVTSSFGIFSLLLKSLK